MSEPSPDLIDRCRNGDRGAFADLVQQVQSRIYNLAYNVLHNQQEAEDMAQEVFLRIWRALPEFRGDSKFSTWIHRIAVNASLNRRRQLQSQAPVIDDENILERLCGSSGDPPAQAEHRDRQRAVWEAVDRLSDKYRLVITLFYQEQLTYQEVAEVLGLPLGTVKAQLNRARKALAEMLSELGGEL